MAASVTSAREGVPDETGGEAYFLGSGPPPSLAPFLTDLADHLSNQYLVEFSAAPTGAPNTLQQVTVKSKIGDLELMAPDEVWVAGGEPASPSSR
jgi:hypothetical protein